MAQHTGRQYDDDLTVGADEYNESFSTDYVDLFEPLGDDDAPIAKLKTIILSIDWEINDDILHQLNDELQDLKDVWAGNKINLIYIQALEKIGRYIFTERANAHPSAIKLLLGFYYNLEKIVSSASMSEEEKKQLLLQDVKRFDQFKLQISPPAPEGKSKSAASPAAAQSHVAASDGGVPMPASRGQKNVLTNLKAIVLGIDWEISDKELVRLSEEVNKLEKIFSESRAKLIFLQGIGALGNYIRSAKSSAHPDAFKLLHSFYEGLERTYNEVLSKDQEKAILLAEVKKFNAFKVVIASVASEVVVPVDASASLSAAKEAVDEEEGEEESGNITPAFADMPDDVHGFRVDTEAIKSDVDHRVASFFGEAEAADQFGAAVGVTTDQAPEGPEISARLDALFGDDEEFGPTDEASDIALLGVNVETEADDDSDEKALPLQGEELAPALAEAGGQTLDTERAPSCTSPLKSPLAATPVIPGIDVETEADDESEEAVLPREHGGVAPALAFSDEKYGFREAELAADSDEDEFDLEDRLDSFFGAEIEEASQGNTLHVSDDAREESSPATGSELMGLESEVTAAEPAIFASVIEELPLGGEHILAEDQNVLAAEPLFEHREVEPTVGGLIFEGVAAGVSADATKEGLEVVFEPVGDDIEVDELPVATGTIAADGEITPIEQESLARLRQCVTSILLKKDEVVFPSFFAEIERLRQGWQTQYVKNIFLQLLVTVGHYIDAYREGADAESLMLLQSLCDKLEQVCQAKTGLDDGREQILFEETGKVLLWQQGLISVLTAKQGREDDSSEVVDDVSDLFLEE